ncbi:MAG: preprotein translocase subunit SecA [Gammaproteobacteria bacterium]|nr:preprotein translocase subunit SecA [Gammaproteobacteria bacterium]
MSSSAQLRPGVAVGPYPQIEDIRENWMDRTAAKLVGLFRQRVSGRNPGHTRFLALVESEGTELAGLSDKQLKQHIPDLRRKLYSEGLEDHLVARAFAMIREVAERQLGIRHFDVQLIGGRIMLAGKIAEMETGEGKTLTATLPACTAALAGIPVHVITVNDFLVQRDAAWMEPLYRFFGLSVGVIYEGIQPEERRKAYACDIAYGTNKQLVFDYLKDQLLLGRDAPRMRLQIERMYATNPRARHLLLRGLCFVIVDEADSVLIDEARTPLIISNKGDSSFEEKIYGEAIDMAGQLTVGSDFTIHPREHNAELTEQGRRHATSLAEPYGGVWIGARRREDLIQRALAALHLYHKDKQYIVRNGKIQIVDEYTGRVMADRSWERGLHQMIEAKEGCEITGQQETLARISYQRFFRRYLRVTGMTGTVREVAGELWSVYRLPVVTIPTNKPVKREQLRSEVYLTAEEKWNAVIDSVRRLHAEGRPILVGTRSVEASEHVSGLLFANGLVHHILNARQDQDEAEVISRAGERGRITVATNMAGRGTDIKLAPGVAEIGGLHVLATEFHDSRRIDRQLFGRCGRQGDPGSYQVIVSLEDEVFFEWIKKNTHRLRKFFPRQGVSLPGWYGIPLARWVQNVAENRNSRIRQQLLKMDQQLSDLLSFTGRGE